MFVWNPANPQRRSREWWFFDLGMGATPPHTGRLIPYEGRLIRGWCHHHPKALLKMTRNEGCLIWGWGHTWWGLAHTWWLLARPLWSCAHTPMRPGSSLREWGSAHQGKGSHWAVSRKAHTFFMTAVQRCLSVWYSNWAMIVWTLQTPLSGSTGQRPPWRPCADSQTATHSHHHVGAWKCWSWPSAGWRLPWGLHHPRLPTCRM